MNYLAHLYLSDQTPEGFAGSLLGDFVAGDVAGKYDERIEHAIRLHRKIDFFTDTNAIVKRSKSMISGELRRYAGVLVDVFYDHFLAVDFDRYADVSLKVFSETAYRALEQYKNLFPENFRLRISAIAEYDLLGSYRTLDGIGTALERISRRIKRQNDLAKGIDDLKNNYEELKIDFEEYFPSLVAFVQASRKT